MIPQITDQLNNSNIEFLKAFSKSCRSSILQMTANAGSGHPGGSLSCIDYLSVIYTYIISQTGNKIVISNGHISPAVYSVLSELKYIPKEDVINTFRKVDSPYEGHVARSVNGVWYGTGPLGIGVSAALGFAMADKKSRNDEKVFAILGDGESQEGQVYEMMNMSNKYNLNNLIVFLDYNRVQLSDSLEHIMPLNTPEIFKAGGWNVIEINGHEYSEIWQAIQSAYEETSKPTLIVGNTIMGKGVNFMEEEGKKHKPTWHGNAPKIDQIQEALKELTLSNEEIKILENFQEFIKWHPVPDTKKEILKANHINTGKQRVYNSDEITDCRSAYGMALLDLAKLNPEVIALSADLKVSVMTKFVAEELPDQHIECGIAEQNMISVAGSMSLSNYIPFVSTFGAFMSSRAKDQARVNDINECNVKMVATHSGLSVGEDGPTHQSIDDMGSFLGMFNTMIIEPADPNHTDRIIRYVGSHYGNFYIRMGRHKFPVITKEDGSVFYDENYVYEYGKTDNIREGKDLTIVASGAMVNEAIKAISLIKDMSIEIVAVSSIKKFDENLIRSILKTKKVLTIEDHNTFNGLGSQLARLISIRDITLDKFEMLGVEQYQMSGKYDELYKKAELDPQSIANKCKELI